MRSINEIIDIIPVLMVSIFGGVANQIYKVSKGHIFKRSMFVANIFLSGFVGYVVQGFIPADGRTFGPLIAIAGYCAYPILQIIEKKFPDFITKYIK